MSNFANIKITAICPVAEKEVTIPIKSVLTDTGWTSDDDYNYNREFSSDFKCPACEGYHYINLAVRTINPTEKVSMFEEN